MTKRCLSFPAVLAVLILLLSISLTACAVENPGSAEQSASETAPASAAVAKADTPNAEPTQDTEHPPSLPNLNLDSDSEMILQKILWSHTTWQTLWAEGLDRMMYPDGSGTVQGEIRSQAWVSQPGRNLREMYGAQGEEPSFLQVVDGVSVLRMDSNGDFREVTGAPDFLDIPFVPSKGASAEEARHPMGRVLQTALAQLVFPFPMSSEDGTFKGLSMDEVAGRQALVVDLYRVGGIRTDRLWVDAEKGILLRRQHFGKNGSEQPLSETQLTAIVYDLPIPAGCFSLTFENIPGFEAPPVAGRTEAAETGSVGVIPGMGVVNLRLGPGTDFEVIGQLNEGVEVPVIGTTAFRDWWQLFLDGRPAWVYVPLVEFTGDPSSVPVVDVNIPMPVSGSDIDLDRATEVIESFTGRSDIQLSLVEISAMPNADLRPGWQLMDPSGRLYWLDVQTYQLVQIEPSPLAIADPASKKSSEGLRQIAEELALEYSRKFVDLKDELVYSEGDKLGQSFFFHWEDQTNPWLFMPPVLQVGLTSDGQLLSWLNTLDLVE
jgi:hypothetical protein